MAALSTLTVIGSASQDIAASVWLTGVTVTASGASGIMRGLGMVGKMGDFAGIGISALNIMSSLVYSFGFTKDIGDGIANIASPASNFLDKNGNLIKHINDGSNAVYQQVGSGYFTHYKFKGFDESQGGIDKVDLTTAIEEQQDLNEDNIYLKPIQGETYCNYATEDILNTVSSSVVDGNELRIVGMANTMTTLFSKSPLLKQVSLQVAEENAKNGGLSLFGYFNTNPPLHNHGHVGTFSVGENINKGQIANVGSHNGFYPIVSKQIFSQKTIQKVDFFIPRNNLIPIMNPIIIPFFNF